MKKFLVLVLALCMVLSASAFASLPVGLELTPTPEDYAATDLSEHKTVNLYLVGDGESSYPDYPEILGLINEELAKFNTTLEVTILSWSDADTMYPLVLTGGDPCDLIFSATWRNLWSGAADEAFYVLDEEFIATYMPYTAQYQPEESWAQVTYAGKIQGVTQNKQPENPQILGIRTDLAEDFGLSTDLQTWEDLEAYMLGIAAHTSENGIFAWNAGNNDYGLSNHFFKQYGIYTVGGNSWYRFVGTDECPTAEELIFFWSSDEFKAWIAKANELMNAGCWSRSALSKEENAAQSFQNGTGAVVAWNYTIYQYMTYLEEQVLGVEKMSATKGINLYSDTYLSPAEGYNNNLIAITAFSSDPYRAAMVLDILKFNTAINEMICMGIEGRHWTDLGDGYFENGPEFEKYAPSGMSWAWALQNDNWFTKYDRSDRQDMETFIKANLYNNQTMAFSFDTEPVSVYYSALSAAVEEYQYTLYLGMVDDPEAAFAEFVDTLNASGLEIYDEEYRTQYQAWYDVNFAA